MTEPYEMPFDAEEALRVLTGMQEPTRAMRMTKRQLLRSFDNSTTAAAKYLGISHPAISHWGTYIPTVHVIGYHLRKAQEHGGAQ